MSEKQQTIKDSASAHVAGGWILHARAREYYWEGAGQLSIKTFFGGHAHYRVRSAHHAVDDSCYLVLNQGQTYTIAIESPQPVESFCLFFDSEFVGDVQRGLSRRIENLLDYPFARDFAPVCFFEKNYAHDKLLSPALFRLRSNHRKHDPGWLIEQLHDVVERLLRVHQKTFADAERLDCVRLGTREELYRRVCRARDYLWAMFSEPVTLSELAQVACLSPNHLLRTFRKVFGTTPHQFLIERRVHEAKRLLTKTDLSVTEICLACGFESLGSFSSLFRKRCGFAPVEYRRQKGDF